MEYLFPFRSNLLKYLLIFIRLEEGILLEAVKFKA